MPEQTMSEALLMYAIYESPSDYPGEFVVRRWRVPGSVPGQPQARRGEGSRVSIPFEHVPAAPDLRELADRLERLARLAAGQLRAPDPDVGECYDWLIELEQCAQEAQAAIDDEPSDQELAARSGGCFP